MVLIGRIMLKHRLNNGSLYIKQKRALVPRIND